jgi:hypothetical protein
VAVAVVQTLLAVVALAVCVRLLMRLVVAVL